MCRITSLVIRLPSRQWSGPSRKSWLKHTLESKKWLVNSVIQVEFSEHEISQIKVSLATLPSESDSIFDLATTIVANTRSTVTVPLCARIALLVSLSFVVFIYTHAKSSLQRKVHVESCDGSYWDKVDARLLFIRNTADGVMWKITKYVLTSSNILPWCLYHEPGLSNSSSRLTVTPMVTTHTLSPTLPMSTKAPLMMWSLRLSSGCWMNLDLRTLTIISIFNNKSITGATVACVFIYYLVTYYLPIFLVYNFCLNVTSIMNLQWLIFIPVPSSQILVKIDVVDVYIKPKSSWLSTLKKHIPRWI